MAERLAIFVPTSRTTPLATIVAPGSAIIGPAGDDATERVTVDYEGAVYGQSTVLSYADRARHAAGRLAAALPDGCPLLCPTKRPASGGVVRHR